MAENNTSPFTEDDAAGEAYIEATEKAEAEAKAKALSEAQAAYDPDSLTPAAKRALAEAEERRNAAAETKAAAKEYGGRDGPEPVRYGDWESKGLAIDF